MALPAWLDPWWHLDFVVNTPLAPDAVRNLLGGRTARLRGRAASDGGLVVVRRGGLMNQFVRARADLSTADSGTTVHIRIARAAWVSVSFTIFLPFFFFVTLKQVVGAAVAQGPSVAVGDLPFLVVRPIIWAVVLGANYTSARSEAKDLRRLITDALKTA